MRPTVRADAPGEDYCFRFLQTLDSACADGVFAVDLDQRIVYWSQTAEGLTGYEPSEVTRRACYEVMMGRDSDGHPYCRPDCPTIVAARRGRLMHNYDLQVVTREGRNGWYNMSIISLPDRQGRTRLVVHMFRDVTSRRVAEVLTQDPMTAVERSFGQGEPGKDRSRRAPETPLTARELEVLHLFANGLNAPQIAQSLGIARATARNHAERILSKLQAHNRVEAIARAGQMGIL